MKVFNTGDGFLGTIGYLLALFFWLYALVPLVNVVRFVENEISNSKGNTVRTFLRDAPLALIRAAGYIVNYSFIYRYHLYFYLVHVYQLRKWKHSLG